MNRSIRYLLPIAIGLTCTCAFATNSLNGSYTANGVPSKLAHVLARHGDPFHGDPTIKLVFTEQDASKDQRPDFHAQMGDLGDALVVTVMKNGDGYDVIGSEFAHSALKHSGASSIGVVEVKDVKVAGSEISGKVVSLENADLFHEPITIDLTFTATLP